MTGTGTKPRLAKLFMFNSNWGQKEGMESEKIIYFWPSETGLNEKNNNVGLVEAVVTFGQTFSATPSHSLHTQKTRTVWRQVETGIFLVITVNIPWVKKQTKEGDVHEYRPDEVSDKVLLGIVDKAYSMFCLFFGGVHHILETKHDDEVKVRERAVLQDRVSHFFTRYLATLKLDQSSITDMWSGVQYLPLEAEPFLRVQTLVNRCMMEYPDIESCLFLQQGQLVWSEVKPDVTRLLVHYLTTTLLPSLTSSTSPTSSVAHQGRWLVPGNSSHMVLPQVHFQSDKHHPRNLVVFHAINSTLCLLLKDQPSESFYDRFSDTMGPLVSNLSADLTHIWATHNDVNSATSRKNDSSDSVKFIYYNGANFALKSTVEAGHESVINLAADLTSDLGGEDGEVVGKLNNDHWLVVRMAGLRTVVIILNMKNLNLLEVSEEVMKLDKSCFAKICLL